MHTYVSTYYLHTLLYRVEDRVEVLVSYLLMSQEMKRVDCKGSFLFSLCKEKCVRWLIIFFKARRGRNDRCFATAAAAAVSGAVTTRTPKINLKWVTTTYILYYTITMYKL